MNLGYRTLILAVLLLTAYGCRSTQQTRRKNTPARTPNSAIAAPNDSVVMVQDRLLDLLDTMTAAMQHDRARIRVLEQEVARLRMLLDRLSANGGANQLDYAKPPSAPIPPAAIPSSSTRAYTGPTTQSEPVPTRQEQNSATPPPQAKAEGVRSAPRRSEPFVQPEPAKAEIPDTIRSSSSVPQFSAEPPPKVATTPENPEMPKGADVGKTLTREERYTNALALFNEHRYTESLAAFRDLESEDANGPLTSNYEYWRGECLYALGQYKQAIETFENIVEQYPNSTKADDAQFKIGESYEKQSSPSAARVAYETLLKNYPETEYRARALARMKRLK